MGRVADLLNNAIEEMETDDLSRADIISRMASAAGISDSTVGQILRAEILCPPTRRLRGFIRVLDITLQQMEGALRADGCIESDEDVEDVPRNYNKKEARVFNEDLELRVQKTEHGPILSGYGIVYNKKSRLLGNFVEMIRPGAMRKILQSNPDVKSAFNHNENFIFGRTKSGTMQLEENQKGVKYTVYPPDTTWAKDIMTSIDRGDIDGSSFTFRVNPEGEEWKEQSDGTMLRIIHEFDFVGEMGPVSEPAYLDTSTSVRSARDVYEAYTEKLEEQRNTERLKEINKRKREIDLL